MAKKIQVSVTPNEAKRLICQAIARMPEVRHALEHGRVVLKGGSTVSPLAEELISRPLVLHGRITQRGAVTADHGDDPHVVLLEKGQAQTLHVASFEEIDEAAARLGRGDVLVIGANALDINRKTAMMVGRPLGTLAGRFLPGLMIKGVKFIIAVGWEKLIPNTIEEAQKACGNENIDVAMGMAVGLLPLTGTVVTETDAISMLTGTKTTVIGAGGILGGEGATTFIIDGEDARVKQAWDIIQSVKGAPISGAAESLAECQGKSMRCTYSFTVGGHKVLGHLCCIHRQPGLAKKVFSEA